MIEKQHRNLAIVAHDAGAAAHIFSWLDSGFININECRFCLDGPAKKLFKSLKPKIKLFSIYEVLAHADTLISGTGWSSSLEHNARALAKEKGIYSVAVIDHWLNYSERFIRKDIQVLPDTIWVSDEYAHLEAKSCFPDIEIVQQRNDYLKSNIEAVLAHSYVKQEESTNVLYLLEPIRDIWADDAISGEFQALDYFINSIPSLDFGKKYSIILRPHPSESLNKYDKWIESLDSPHIRIEKEQSLPELLAWSDIVVGCETYAMVIALSVDKRVISSLPKNAHSCRLPHENIERLNQIS